MSENHEFYMQRALGLAGAGLGRVWPNPSVGCVVVKDGAVIGEARTQDGGRPHAEEYVLGALGDAARGATAYVTLEPCCHARETINCTQNLIRAGVARVVIACADPDPRMAGRGIAALRAAGIDVVTGVLEEDAKKGHQGFFLRVTQNRPYVLLKQAISRDGMIAAAPGVRTQISGAQAHRYVHELRATYDAVAVGVNTVLADDPLLTTRLEGINHRIVRIVFDSDLRIPLGSKLVQTAGHDPLWALYKNAPDDARKALEGAGVRLLQTGACVQSALNVLAGQGITRLMVEGGARLHHSFIAAGLVDEVQVIQSPKTLGAGGLQAADFASLGFDCVETRDLGEDLLAVYKALGTQ